MRTLAVLVMLLTLSACSLPVFFRVPVVQGNVVTAQNVGKLKLGMTKSQVEYVMGTPLVDAAFENDRWDYVFYYRNPRAHVRQSKLDLYFVNGTLSSIAGDEEYTAQVLKNAHDQDLGGAPLPADVSPGVDHPPASATNNVNTNDEVPGSNNAGSAAPVVPQRSPQQSPLSF